MHTSFRSRLKFLRKELDKNQSEVAKLLGVTPGYMSKLENGGKIPSEQFIISICRAFNVSREWLESGEGEMWILDNRDESGRTTPVWHEILRSLGVRSSIFNVTETGVFESEDMKYVHNRIYDAARSQKSLIISGDVGSGKTVILQRFLDKYKKHEHFKVVFTRCLSGDRYRLDDFYDSIILDISEENTKRAKKLHERKLEVKKVLENYPKPVVLIADNAGDVPKEVLHQLISFQQSTDVRNLSVILCGSSLEYLKLLPNTEFIGLHGLNDTSEIPAYIKQLSNKTGNKLPQRVPPEMFKGSTGFLDIQDRYLKYAWRQIQISERKDNIISDLKR
jgi:transcriptional regulator with XRE-family HTH domain